MEIEAAKHLGAVMRTVSELEVGGKPARAVTLTRTYDTSPQDLWDAVVNPERLPRWFLPVTGDLKLNGRYQLVGNAGGTITTCDQAKHLELTWEFGDDTSWVDIRFDAEDGDRCRLTLTHTAHLSDHWEQYGPSAVGTGWELGLLGLHMHIESPETPKPDETEFATSPEGKALITGSCEAWGQAAVDAGEPAEKAMTAARRTAGFYTGVPEDAQ